MIIKDSSKSSIDTELTSKNFTITASAKAFNLLSNLLYSNKIKAIIRELSCNAYDSHVEAGKKDVPFKVTLPSEKYPFWEIQDFGVGLSEDDVYSVYINYFKSTKTKTNSQVGCFGLGSKTPFSYTKNFFITSVYNGIKTSFFIFINEEDFPSITKTNQEETDEVNGLTIKIPVQSKDFSSFKNYSEEIYSYFEVKPIINGELYNHNFYKTIESFEAEGYKLHVYKNNVDNNYSNYNVIQGNICYPIADSNRDYIEDLRTFLFWRIYAAIEVPIGTFEVTASREQLQFNKTTNTKLQEISKILAKAIVKKIKDVLQTPNNFSHRCSMHELIYGVDPILSSFTESTNIISEILIKNESLETITIRKDKYGHFKNVYRADNKYIIQNVPLSDKVREKLAKYIIQSNKTANNYLLSINSQTEYDKFIEFWNQNGNFDYTYLSNIAEIETEATFYAPKTKIKVNTITDKSISLMNYFSGRLKTVNLKEKNFYIPNEFHYNNAISTFIAYFDPEKKYGIYYEPYMNKVTKNQLKKFGVINLMNMKNLKMLNDFYKYTQEKGMKSIKYHYNDNEYKYYEEIINNNLHLIENKSDVKKIKFAYNYKYNNYFPTNNPMFVSYPKILNRIRNKVKEESKDVKRYLDKAPLIIKIRHDMSKSEADKICKIILNEK